MLVRNGDALLILQAFDYFLTHFFADGWAKENSHDCRETSFNLSVRNNEFTPLPPEPTDHPSWRRVYYKGLSYVDGAAIMDSKWLIRGGRHLSDLVGDIDISSPTDPNFRVTGRLSYALPNRPQENLVIWEDVSGRINLSRSPKGL